MSALRAVGLERSLAGALTTEVAELERARASHALELPPELVRLGVGLPEPTRHEAPALASPPDLVTLAAVARIGMHLGALSVAAAQLPEGEARVAEERLSRVRILVDCASALADLRGTVSASMRTARAA